MKIGVIDLGTNTFHLLIADASNEMTILHKEKVAVQLGKGGITKNILQADAIERALKTLIDFKAKIDHEGVEKVLVTGTSAVRNANNQKEFIDLVKEVTGLEINVLSGDQEASSIHMGVKEFVDFENDTALIMDIGGGSIEFIIADQDNVKWLKSYELGGQRLIENFHKSDPISEKETEELSTYLIDALNEVFIKCIQHKASFLIGSSGSFDTFWDIYTQIPASVPTEVPVLSNHAFEKIYKELTLKDKSERMQIPGMIPMRVEMIVSAAIVTQVIMSKCYFDKIKISPYALKEGLLYHGLPKTK
jgi:exopolyphosphatase/guanosine-5'-triphosphate,3'-diphosphate pyrophosphatase